MTAKARRLLTIGHSYCVRRNRELAEAMASAGQGEEGARWEVTVAAPAVFPGDLGPVTTRQDAGERATLRLLPVQFARHVHVMRYGRGLADLLSEPWDVVHCWEEPFVWAGTQVARRARHDAALVFATFQNIAKRYPPPFGAFERYAMTHAAGWIAFGHTIAEALGNRRGYRERPHAVIPFGVDTSRFALPLGDARDVRGDLGWRDSEVPVVGYLGRFVEEKGLDVLLAALDGLRGRGVRWRALFVGGGPMEPVLRAFATRHARDVHVAGGVSHDEVPAYLHAMDILAAPSRTTPAWREQFGRMIVEAFACGVAVAGSDSGEIPHVIGDAGLVIPEGNVGAWEGALADLLADREARQAWGAKGRARAEREFAWPVVGRRHLEFLEQVVRS